MEHYLSLVVKAIFVENMALAFFLGMCSFLAVSKKVETAVGELALQQRQVEAADVEAGQIGAVQEVDQTASDLPECGCVAHVLVADPVHGGRRGRDRSSRVDPAGAAFPLAIDVHAEGRDLDDPVALRIRTGRFQV